jgi:D-alanyl-D-alanine carboxypeptidase/D-alanyl-D-alanine-endopeptidase (penicillin-binding protein 4)
LTTFPIDLPFYGRVPPVRALRSALVPLLALLALILPASAGAATKTSAPTILNAAALASHLAAQMHLAGARSGAYVLDANSGRVLFTQGGATARPPASTEKLLTFTTLLERLGPNAQFTTSVLGTGSLQVGGVWKGDLYLRGGGDPTFGDSAFIKANYGGVGSPISTLVSDLVARGIKRVTGKVYGDESLFDSLRGSVSPTYAYDSDLTGVLSALSFDRGEQGPLTGPHAPAAFAAQELATDLQAAHISVSGGYAAATTPAGATLLASELSPTLTQLMPLTLLPSDNFFAETLLKDLAAKVDGKGTTAAGAALVSSAVSALQITAHVLDGSGLNHQDAISPLELVTLLRTLEPTPIGGELRAAMPVAGVSGTLDGRMEGTLAAGHCEAKTGTLDDASNLAGYCTAAGGHTLVFSLEMDDIGISSAHAIQDNMTEALARFNDGTPATPIPAQPNPSGSLSAPLLPPIGASPTISPAGGTSGATGTTGATGAKGASGTSTTPTGGSSAPAS